MQTIKNAIRNITTPGPKNSRGEKILSINTTLLFKKFKITSQTLSRKPSINLILKTCAYHYKTVIHPNPHLSISICIFIDQFKVSFEVPFEKLIFLSFAVDLLLDKKQVLTLHLI